MGRSTSTSEAPDVEIKGKKISLSLRAIIILAGVLGVGGGTFGAVRLATVGDVEASEKRVEKKVQEEKKERETGFVTFDARLVVQETATKDLKNTVEEVQNVQHWQVADQAAERLSQEAPKHKRKSAYKRLFKRNLDRLKSKRPPCSNLDCPD